MCSMAKKDDSDVTLCATVLNATQICLLALVFMIVFLVLFTLDRQIFERPIIFYDALFCIGLTAVLIIVLYIAYVVYKRPRKLGIFRHTPAALAVFVLAAYSFSITVPALIERSISLFIVSQVAATGQQGVSLKELQDVFYSDYILRNEAIPKRLEEQALSGNLTIVDGKYVATRRGQFVFATQQWFIEMFKADRRYIIQ